MHGLTNLKIVFTCYTYIIQAVKNRLDQLIFTSCDKNMWGYRDAL